MELRADAGISKKAPFGRKYSSEGYVNNDVGGTLKHDVPPWNPQSVATDEPRQHEDVVAMVFNGR